MIDPLSLVTLAAVDRTGSVVAAAGELGYTPSAVSQQVKRLERQVGASLLDRVGRGVMLTELGRRLVVEGRPILDGLEHLEAGLLATDPDAPVVGRVRLAAFSTGIRGLVAPTLRDLIPTAPGLVVDIVELDPHDAIDVVARGSADAALVHNWGELTLPFPEHVEVVQLGSDVADVLVHREHPMAGRPSVGAAELADDTWVCAPPGSVCHSWLIHMFDGHGNQPRIRHWAMEFGTQIGLVAEGLAVALVPRLGREHLPPEVVPVPVTDPRPIRRVMMTWRRSMAPSPAIQGLYAALSATAGERLEQSAGPAKGALC
ncbi:MAG: LysR family transcriptional regulator [Nostocoides sp.]